MFYASIAPNSALKLTLLLKEKIVKHFLDLVRLSEFRRDEAGAVTVDWVVLTAALVGLGVAVLTSVSGGATDLASDINTNVGNMAADVN